ncbi:hypothetical protein F4779DRAFT_635215 [Xylariaceae sp. FL0662B]|nr:hypothetical protein F4779DRAFT_635215 [Xylariaceae sp. FL0662B]
MEPSNLQKEIFAWLDSAPDDKIGILAFRSNERFKVYDEGAWRLDMQGRFAKGKAQDQYWNFQIQENCNNPRGPAKQKKTTAHNTSQKGKGRSAAVIVVHEGFAMVDKNSPNYIENVARKMREALKKATVEEKGDDEKKKQHYMMADGGILTAQAWEAQYN